MAFHGAMLGIIIALHIMAKSHKISFLALCDRVAMVTPIGLFLGRIANFINGELYGRITNVPWAMIFPMSDGQPRHPSQLYEAGLEGLFLGLTMFFFWRRGVLSKGGLMSGIFCVGYGFSRLFIELFREPDTQIGFLMDNFTMGQLLSVPMILVGIYLIKGRIGEIEELMNFVTRAKTKKIHSI